MLTCGLIHQAHNGLFHLLPLAVRAVKKLTSLVEHFMDRGLNAQKVYISSLTPGELWKITGIKTCIITYVYNFFNLSHLVKIFLS